jgi:hypothetical protein
VKGKNSLPFQERKATMTKETPDKQTAVITEAEDFVSDVEEARARSDIKIREKLVGTTQGVIYISLLFGNGMFLLDGLGILNLKDEIIKWVGGSVLASIVTNVLLPYRSMFPGRKKDVDNDDSNE